MAAGRQAGRERALIHWLISQVPTRATLGPKQGARNSNQMSHVGGSDAITSAFIGSFPRSAISRKLVP